MKEFLVTIPWPRKQKSREVDLEGICKITYPVIKSYFEAKWLDHTCDEKGCKSRFIVIDGNEKLYRSICAAEKNKVKGNKGEINYCDLCIRNPRRGNQHAYGLKYCSFHSDNKEDETEDQLDLRPITQSITKSIPRVICSELGCKESSNVDRFFTRTAGMFFMFRPCGIRLANFEMYTAESLSSVLTYLIDIFGKNPSPSQLQEIVYDRSCDLHPFLEKLRINGHDIAG